MKLLSLFSGIGAFEKALENLDIEYELVGFSEIDEWAIKSYCRIHNIDDSFNLGDIGKIPLSKIPNADLVTYGFPCQDISTAGKLKGINNNTRSGLLFEAERIINHKKPKYAIAENVKNLIGKKFKEDFDNLLKRLDSYGYNSYWKVLNSKDYGIPQSRERVFIVSIRKDIDDGGFKFPKGKTLEKDLRYFSHFRKEDDLTDNFINRYNEIHSSDIGRKEFMEYVRSLRVRKGIGTKLMGLYSFNEMDTITTLDGITGTLTTRNVQNYNKKYETIEGLFKPSPRMTWRLMGFDDLDFNKVEGYVPDKELYKQAGNSIVVNVLEEIFKELF